MLNFERFLKLLIRSILSSGGVLTTSTAPVKVTVWLLGTLGGWGQPCWDRILPDFIT